MLKLGSQVLNEQASLEEDSGLHGEKLALVSAEEKEKWPLRNTFILVFVACAGFWLVVAYFPTLINALAGVLMELLT